MEINVGIVLVLFKPCVEDLVHIRKIANTCIGCVVDNSPSMNFDGEFVGNFCYIYNGANKGIAEAQNIGVNYLVKERKCDYIVFLDQDSRIDQEYVKRITETYIQIKSFEPKLALLGPTAINTRSKEEYKSVFHPKKATDGLFVPCREIISSGSCVSIDVLLKVGLHLSWLFIDYVDFEWCWRANSMGYVCGTTPSVSIQHSVGKKEYYIGNYIIIISSPMRYFYQGRNYIKLIGLPYVPLQWKFTNFVKTLLRMIYLPFIPGGGTKSWFQLVGGLISGLVR